MKSSKFQVPSSKEAPNFKFQFEAFRFEDRRLEFSWNLEPGTWKFLSC